MKRKCRILCQRARTLGAMVNRSSIHSAHERSWCWSVWVRSVRVWIQLNLVSSNMTDFSVSQTPYFIKNAPFLNISEPRWYWKHNKLVENVFVLFSVSFMKLLPEWWVKLFAFVWDLSRTEILQNHDRSRKPKKCIVTLWSFNPNFHIGTFREVFSVKRELFWCWSVFHFLSQLTSMTQIHRRCSLFCLQCKSETLRLHHHRSENRFLWNSANISRKSKTKIESIWEVANRVCVGPRNISRSWLRTGQAGACIIADGWTTSGEETSMHVFQGDSVTNRIWSTIMSRSAKDEKGSLLQEIAFRQRKIAWVLQLPLLQSEQMQSCIGVFHNHFHEGRWF
jgi:hypothetical protein